MASKAHQFIADVIATRMAGDGYQIVSFEGKSTLDRLKSKLPPKIYRHRPDIIGIKDRTTIAVGEAKTKNDLTDRTHEQINDFTNKNLWPSDIQHKLYLGYPDCIDEKIKSLFEDTSVKDSTVFIVVPERLLPYE